MRLGLRCHQIAHHVTCRFSRPLFQAFRMAHSIFYTKLSRWIKNAAFLMNNEENGTRQSMVLDSIMSSWLKSNSS